MIRTTHEDDVNTKVSTTSLLESNTERWEEDGEASKRMRPVHNPDLARNGTYMICKSGNEWVG